MKRLQKINFVNVLSYQNPRLESNLTYSTCSKVFELNVKVLEVNMSHAS